MHNVIVTGGSRGLGLGIARRLTSVGYCVIAVARKETSELANEINEAENARQERLHFLPFDLGETEQIPDLVKQIRKDFGATYGLVNNAGVSFDGTLALTPNSQIERLVRDRKS